MRQSPSASELFTLDLEFHAKAVTARPENIQYQQYLRNHHFEVGRVAHRLQRDDALHHLNRAIELSRAIFEKLPSDKNRVEYAQKLSRSARQQLTALVKAKELPDSDIADERHSALLEEAERLVLVVWFRGCTASHCCRKKKRRRLEKLTENEPRKRRTVRK